MSDYDEEESNLFDDDSEDGSEMSGDDSEDNTGEGAAVPEKEDWRMVPLREARDCVGMWENTLTEYEHCCILGTRAEQLSHGATPCVEVPPHVHDPIQIAELEMQKGVSPFFVIRGEEKVDVNGMKHNRNSFIEIAPT